MAITQRTLETLIGLVEVKLNCMEVYDRDDARELSNLEHCLRELRNMARGEAFVAAPVVAFPGRSRRRRAAV